MSKKVLIKNIFDTIDLDKDGSITYNELKKWREETLTKYNLNSKDVSRTQKIFFELFNNKKNTISLEEFSFTFEKYLQNLT
jgi:Ca2+-binding EF-hand superfamily protein